MSSSNENLGPDPSMEEILSSIRRILKEDERTPPGEAPSAVAAPAQTLKQPEAAQPRKEDSEPVLILDPSMMLPETSRSSSASAHPPPQAAAQKPPVQSPVQAPRAAAPAPAFPVSPPSVSAPPAHDILGASAAESASSHLGALMRTIPLDRGAAVSRGGPTLEDIVRDELRPLLRGWLDANLPPLVERIVRAEIERLVARTNL
jgi:cell pole-organizing protein PopZ